MEGQSGDRHVIVEENLPESVASDIRQLFEEILHTAVIGEHDDFFSLGGQSIDAANLISRIGNKFGILLPLLDFFEDPTVYGAERLLRRYCAAPHREVQIDPLAGIAVRDTAERFALNEVQHAYWIGRSHFFTLGNIGTHVYVEYASAELDHERLQNAWNRLIERHPMLRTVIDPDGLQRTLPIGRYTIALHDVRNLPDAEQDAQQSAVRARMSHQILDTTQPMYELVMTRRRDTCILHCSLDLLIADLWSTQIIFRELEHFYVDPHAPLAPLAFRFQDYVFSESERLHRPAYDRARRYWTARLDSLPPGPALPLAQPPSEIRQPRFTRRRAVLPRAAWQRLKLLAAQHRLTPSALLASAFSDVLARWTSSHRFTLNLTLFNRAPLDPQVNDIVGDFTTLTLLQIDHDPHSGFVERAQRVQQQLWRDLDHRHYSGVNVMRDYARRAGRQECAFPVVFTSSLVHGSSSSPAFLGQQIYGISQTPQIWLDHQIFEEDEGLIYQWDAVEALFPAGLLDDMFASQGRYLEEIAERDAAQADAYRHAAPRLPDWQIQLFASANDTRAEQPWTNLLDGFEASVRRYPARTAVVAGDVRLTYADLHARVQSVAETLRCAGVGPQSLVPICMAKGWEQVVAALAVQFAGAAYVPVDVALPPARISELVSLCSATVLLTQHAYLATGHWPEGVRVLDVTQLATHPADHPADLPAQPDARPALRADSLAYVIFTSGSTGKPKGVSVSHAAAANTVYDVNRRFGIGENDAVLAVSSLSFDLSVYDVYGMLFAGGKIVVPRPTEAREPSDWLRLLRDENITVWNSVPSLMAMLLDWHGNDRAARPLPLRVALLSGDWVPASMPAAITAVAPHADVVALGGATEAAIWSNYFPAHAPHPYCASVPYGKPLANQRYRVLGADGGDCPVWVPGDLVIEGAGVANGYLNDPAKTAAAFFVDGETGARAYRTGDKGRYLPDGNIEFLGRVDHQVKINGYRVEPGEIEHVLKAVDGIDNAVVAVMPDEKNTGRLTAYVTTSGCGPRDLSVTADTPLSSSFAAVIEASAQFADANAVKIDPRLWEDASAQLDRTVAGAIFDVLAKLGAFDPAGEWQAAGQIGARIGLLPRYQKWLTRSLALLVDSAYLEHDQDQDRYRRTGTAPARDDWQAVIRRVDSLGLPTSGIEFAARSDAVLDAILTGEEEAVGSLFENGNALSAVEMYRNEFRYINEVAAEAFKQIVARFPEDRLIRILEVGAGIGSTTTWLLPHLRGRRARYVYTDISRYFLNFAATEFEDEDCIEFAMLNLEDELALHAFEPHGFDIIVAASVLHATRNLGNTLDHLGDLLAPSGTLMIVEETRFPAVFNLTMGLQQGFDAFEDHALRPAHPLLSHENWTRLLEARGYRCSPPLAAPASASALLGVELILAEGPPVVTRFDAAYVMDAMQKALPDYMVPPAIVRLKSIPLSDNGKVDRHRLPSPWKRQAAARKNIIAPATVTEKLLFSVFGTVLGTQAFSIDESFFELGGDSLLATALAGKLTAALSFDVPIRWIFEWPTIAGLSRRIDKTIPLAKASKAFAGQDSHGSA